MTRAVTILAVCGSLRAKSTNAALLQACALLAPAGIRVELYAGTGDLPHFNADLDTESPPAAVAAWRSCVATADALIIASPEYARGVPGTLKNALDWLAGSSDIVSKPVALLSGSARSTHAQESLTVILRTISANVIAEQPYLAHVLGKSLQGHEIAADPALAAVLRTLLADVARATAARS
jgi:NAD(P)H-dependent FMN reductase